MSENLDSHTDLLLLERMLDSRFRADAWNVFVDRYTMLFLRWFHGWSVDPAVIDDVFQEAMIRVFVSLKNFDRRHNGSFRSWLHVIAHRSWSELLNETRRQVAQRELDPAKAEKWLAAFSHQAKDDLMEMFDAWAREEILELAHMRVRRRVEVDVWETYRMIVMDHRSTVVVSEAMGIEKVKVYDRVSYVRKLIRGEIAEIEGVFD